VQIQTGPLTMRRSGVVPVRVSCAATSAVACHGWITIRLAAAPKGHRAAASAARGRIVARRRYRVKAGRVGAIKVHMSRRGRIRVLQRRKAHCSMAVSVVAPDGSKQVQRRTVTITAKGTA
jgi:hypothetical protein